MQPIPLNTPEYIVEVWDINGVYIADISHLIATSLRINMQLNDVDEINFTLDLVQFEKLCESIGARPLNVIEPYRTDIKIRRNNEYIVGAHVVEVNVNFNSSETNKLIVKCTGYLNHFKDRVVTDSYINKTYAEIAREIIMDSQAPYNYIKNTQFLDGILKWQRSSDASYVIWDSLVGHEAPGALFCNVTQSGNTTGGARYTVALRAGVEYTATYWLRAAITGGNTYIDPGTGGSEGSTAITDTDWNEYIVTWTQASNATYIDFKTSGTTDFWLDEVSLTDDIDNATRRDFGVTLGTDTASPVQQNDRVRNYDLQNVKDGILNLTKLENDNFDFGFDANKVFSTYERKGSDKHNIELVYPQNITSLATSRSAQTLYNKIYTVGAGIGDERIQTDILDEDSGLIYRVRESVQVYNDVSVVATLDAHGYGFLERSKNLYDKIAVVVSNNTLDLNDIETGDAVYVRVDGSSYVDWVDGMYRITGINLDVSIDIEENVSLELEKWNG